MNERNNNFSVQIDGGKLKFIELHHYFLSSYCSTYFLATSRNKEKHDNKRHLLFSVALSSYDRKTKFEPDTILKLKKYVIYALFYIFHFLKSHSTFSYLSVFLTQRLMVVQTFLACNVFLHEHSIDGYEVKIFSQANMYSAFISTACTNATRACCAGGRYFVQGVQEVVIEGPLNEKVLLLLKVR